MKPLTKNTTKAIALLIDQLGEAIALQLNAPAMIPLIIKRFPFPITMPLGLGYLFSISQTSAYGDKTMSHAEMTFIVVDKRNDKDDWGNLMIYPQSLTQDTQAEHEESIGISEGKFSSIKAALYKVHVRFAEEWLTPAKIKPYLK